MIRKYVADIGLIFAAGDACGARMNFKPSLAINCSSVKPAHEIHIYHPSPSYPDNHSTTASAGSSGKFHVNFTDPVLLFIEILATAFILVGCYRIFRRYRAALMLRRNRRVRRQLRADDNNRAILDFEFALNYQTSNGVDEAMIQTSNGVDEALIEKIPVYSFREEVCVLIDSTECSVCLSEFQDHEHLRLLPKCGHAFHLPCIDTWLNSNSNCPFCRAPIFLIQEAAATAPHSSAAQQRQQELAPSYESQPSHESAPDQTLSSLVNGDPHSYGESRSANSSYSRGGGLTFSLLSRMPSTVASDEGTHQIRSESSLSRRILQLGSLGGDDDHGLEIKKHSESQRVHGLLPSRMRLLSRAFSVQDTKGADKKGHPMRRHSSTRRQPFPHLRRSNSTGSSRDDSMELFELRRKSVGRVTSLSVDASFSSVPSASLLMEKSKSIARSNTW
ncbi:hypothetical protein O6H91_07G020300 [Diphasiastrum complanatum]|uniref:Uncharacterized protein n=1 Tax=Diphasiastrum complanatum TaxID=34168 RepID=A0ACC2D3E0_DIPCM|nr:hypothetical protein O6H91_07G020300 [Diphasiastrum complanatum]